MPKLPSFGKHPYFHNLVSTYAYLMQTEAYVFTKVEKMPTTLRKVSTATEAYAEATLV